MEPSENSELFNNEQQQLGEVYAKALVGVGQKSGNLDNLLSELDGVADAIKQLPKLAAALSSPQISVEEKTSLISKAFSQHVSGDLMNFLKVLIAKGRTDCLQSVRHSAQLMHDQIADRVRGTLVTAESVDEKTKTDIESQLSKKLGKDVKLSPTVDASIIGGVVVRIGDTVYDSSVAGQLAQIRAQATQRAADAIREKIDQFAISN